MRPSLGVATELATLGALVWLVTVVPRGAFLALYILALELLATYLIHCPAHYVTGRLVGIRFKEIRLGRSTLAKALPPRMGKVARLAPILTLIGERTTLKRVTKARVALMYASGTVASVSSAFIIAVVATFVEPAAYASIAWVTALGYLLFDLVFSPKTGDLMRAAKALRALKIEA